MAGFRQFASLLMASVATISLKLWSWGGWQPVKKMQHKSATNDKNRSSFLLISFLLYKIKVSLALRQTTPIKVLFR